MRPIWLIEANVEGISTDSLQREIAAQGLESHVVKLMPGNAPLDIVGAERIPLDATVIFTGTLDLMRYIQANRRWTPGGWCDFQNLSCSSFYSHFGPFMLNRDYCFLPIAEAARMQTMLYKRFGVDDQLFIRPDSVDKFFTGQIVDIGDYQEFVSSRLIDPTRMILFATPVTIDHEWRLFIANDQIVDGCQYRYDRRFDCQPGVPDRVREFASNLFRRIQWRPEPLFVLDICEFEGELRIVEFNSYNCAGLLRCDPAKFVAAATAQTMGITLSD